MSQSLAKLYIHLTFSTKQRNPWIPHTISADLHAYVAGTLKNVDSPALIINSVDDHIHVLFRLSINISLGRFCFHRFLLFGQPRWKKGTNADLGRVPQAEFFQPFGLYESMHD